MYACPTCNSYLESFLRDLTSRSCDSVTPLQRGGAQSKKKEQAVLRVSVYLKKKSCTVAKYQVIL